jgi:nicotinate-nucleotide pyrophosphorylase (carboxylating)
VSPAAEAVGIIIAKQTGILAGVEEARAVFRELGVRVKVLRPEGSRLKRGQAIMRVKGKARAILACERVALNLLMRMSGIATATRELVVRARRRNRKVSIAATRKTAPLLSRLDKRAVVVGGGIPHRRDLGDQILIKDNHLKLLESLEEAIRRAKEARRGKVEVEVSSVPDALRAARAGADIVMLDNMPPARVGLAVQALKREGLREQAVLEASGGITPANVGAYAATGVDIISTSYMTMKAPALDMSLELEGQQ